MELFSAITDYGMDFLRALESIRTPFLDEFFLLVTKLGEETLPIVVLCLILWCVDKRLAYGIGVSFFFSGLCVHGLKITCRVPRPWVIDPELSVVGNAKEAAGGFSFPSGHTQNAGSIFLTLGMWMKKKPWAFPVCLLLALLVGFSRMYLGVHTPADVVVGFIITLITSAIAVTVFNKNSEKAMNITLAALGVFSVAAAVYSLVLLGSGVIEHHYASDTCKMGAAGAAFCIGLFIERKYINYSEKTDKLWQQAVKVAIGLGGTLLIKSGLKALLGDNIPADITRYFLMIIWAINVWPILFSKWFKPSEAQKESAEA